jgi:uncharacterized protein YdhG (YjbR/CyaY superfamily)
MTKKPKTVPEYIAAAAPEARAKLRAMRACVRKAAPKSEESIKWGMPAYSRKRIVVIFAAFKRHISFFPTGSALKAFKRDLSRFVIGKGSIQFPLDKPLPLALIRKITLFRVREVEEQDKKWNA